MNYFVNYDGEAYAIEQGAPNSGDVLLQEPVTYEQITATATELNKLADALSRAEKIVEAAQKLSRLDLTELDLVMKNSYCLVCGREWGETEAHHPTCELIALRTALKEYEEGGK